MTLLFVDVRYACYGVEVTNGVVVDAPPIARWMVGKSEDSVLKWLRRKGAAVRVV